MNTSEEPWFIALGNLNLQWQQRCKCADSDIIKVEVATAVVNLAAPSAGLENQASAALALRGCYFGGGLRMALSFPSGSAVRGLCEHTFPRTQHPRRKGGLPVKPRSMRVDSWAEDSPRQDSRGDGGTTVKGRRGI